MGASGSSRRGTAGIALALLFLAGTIVAGAGPAGAQEPDTPTVTVTPSQVNDGQAVTITASGFPDGIDLSAAVECPASFEATLPDETTIVDKCRLIQMFPAGGPPASTSVRVQREFSVGLFQPSGVVNCDAEPGGCIVGVVALVDISSPTVGDFEPITFDPPPDRTPSRGLTDGDAVTVTVEDLEPGEWSVAQCIHYYADTPQPQAAEYQCGPAVAVSPAGDTGTAEIVVRDPLVSRDGTSSYPCGTRDCALVVSSPTEPSFDQGRISFGPPSLTFAPASPADDSTVDVTLANLPGSTAALRQCAGAPSDATCDTATPVVLDEVGGAAGYERRVRSSFTAADGTPASCVSTPCTLVALDENGSVAASAALPVRPPTELTVAPSSDLLEGEPTTVTLVGQTPGARSHVYGCAQNACGELGVAVADASGTVTLTVPATRRMGTTGYCRPVCTILVDTIVGRRTATYAMAPEAVTATPTTALADGDVVTVTGTAMAPTYPGRAFGPFLSGVAVAAQCSVSFEQSPNLFTYFDGCATTAIPLTITDPDLEVDLPVHTSITTFTGRQIDCSEPGACSAGVVRFDQDGSMTGHMTPLAFDG